MTTKKDKKSGKDKETVYALNPRLKKAFEATLEPPKSKKSYDVSPTKEEKIKILRFMKLTRSIDDRIEQKLYRQGKIVGGVYVGRGQEAISVCTAIHMRKGDVASPTHRDMGIFLVRGVPPRRIIAQYMGKGNGLARGRDGNLHMGYMNIGLISPISHLAFNGPVVAGVTLAMKQKGLKNVGFCMNGEGATSRGDWHEGINFCSIQKLPAIFIINNNQFSYSTPTSLSYNAEKLSDRAVGYGIPGETIDGNDVYQVFDSIGRAVKRARDGKGPTIIECITFRMTGHSAHDDAGYVPEKHFKEWKKKDPIDKWVKTLKSEKIITDAELKKMDAEIEEEIIDAADWGEAQSAPEPEECLEDVYYNEESKWFPLKEAIKEETDARADNLS